MNLFARSVLLSGWLSLATTALADCNTAEVGRICTDVAITRLVASDDGANAIQISAATGGLACTASGGFLNVDMTQPYAAQLLSAYLTGRRAKVRLSDYIEACTVVYSWVDG